MESINKDGRECFHQMIQQVNKIIRQWPEILKYKPTLQNTHVIIIYTDWMSCYLQAWRLEKVEKKSIIFLSYSFIFYCWYASTPGSYKLMAICLSKYTACLNYHILWQKESYLLLSREKKQGQDQWNKSRHKTD